MSGRSTTKIPTSRASTCVSWGIAAIGLVINNATIYLLHNRFRLNFYLAKLFATGVVTFWNFFMNYFFTF